jgi:hypothetical protein
MFCYITLEKTNRLSYKRQELLTISEHIGSASVCVGIRRMLLIFRSFLCCVVFFFCLSTPSWVLCLQCSQCLWIVHSWLFLPCKAYKDSIQCNNKLKLTLKTGKASRLNNIHLSYCSRTCYFRKSVSGSSSFYLFVLFVGAVTCFMLAM